jgi:hypothetical protein
VNGRHICLGLHATREAAAAACTDHPEFGRPLVPGVSWDLRSKKWRARINGKYVGSYATQEAAAAAIQVKGVSWDNTSGRWKARYEGKYLGVHATEAAAARACNDYVEHGVEPKLSRASTSQFKGVSWVGTGDTRTSHTSRSPVGVRPSCGQWMAQCKGVNLGFHATEVAAAHAFNIEAQRLGLPLNIIPPATDDGGFIAAAAAAAANAAAAAALEVPGPAAYAREHAGAGCKRAAQTTPAPPPTKTVRLDTSAWAVVVKEEEEEEEEEE